LFAASLASSLYADSTMWFPYYELGTVAEIAAFRRAVSDVTSRRLGRIESE
jgi:hypothetical protein